jgi:hypothetical protein
VATFMGIVCTVLLLTRRSYAIIIGEFLLNQMTILIESNGIAKRSGCFSFK